MMRTTRHLGTIAAAAIATIAVAGAASAQSAAPRTTGYAEAVAQSAFGNVTSQSFGGEIGFNVQPDVQIFVDAGLVRDAAPSSLGTKAQNIAAGVAALAGGADFRVKQPVTFGVAGVKYVVPTASARVQPYILGGIGVAQVKKDVTITPATGDLGQYVTLGSDLSGKETKPMVSLGAGVGVPLGAALVLDLQYRYGRVFTTGEGLNVNRAGIGFGVRF